MNEDSPRYSLLFGSLLAAALFSALVLMVLSGCDLSSPGGMRSVVIGELVEIDEGDTVRLGPSAILTFDDVLQDSRCPTGAACVWQGMAEARFGLITAAGDTMFTLTIDGLVETPYEDNDVVVVADIRFKLLALNPYPNATQVESPPRYTALIRAERGGSAE